MNEPFILQINHQGAQHEFKARLERWGYTHRIAVLIGETTVTFEPDEEDGCRVLAAQLVDVSLLHTVAHKLIALHG